MKKPRPKAGAVPRSTTEDLMTGLRDNGVKVRMRIVIEVDVEEESFNRDGFNENVIEAVRAMESDDFGKVVFLTTEELVRQ